MLLVSLVSQLQIQFKAKGPISILNMNQFTI